MTGILISASSGLFVGLILFAWAWRERSKRAAAEKARDNALADLKEHKLAIDRLRTEMSILRKDKRHTSTQIDVLRNTINGLHEQLARCKDPDAVRMLLNRELGDQL